MELSFSSPDAVIAACFDGILMRQTYKDEAVFQDRRNLLPALHRAIIHVAHHQPSGKTIHFLQGAQILSSKLT